MPSSVRHITALANLEAVLTASSSRNRGVFLKHKRTCLTERRQADRPKTLILKRKEDIGNTCVALEES